MRGDHKDFAVPVRQADATLNQASPTSGTKYTVLDTVKNARILHIVVACTWTVQPTPLEIHVTIDGVAVSFSQTDPVSTSEYEAAYTSPFYDAQGMADAGTRGAYRAFLDEGRSVKVEVEITGGTVSNLSARVKYAKW